MASRADYTSPSTPSYSSRGAASPVQPAAAPRLGQTTANGQGRAAPTNAQGAAYGGAAAPRVENPMIVEQLASYNNAQAVKGQTQGLANSLIGAAGANPYSAQSVSSTSGAGAARPRPTSGPMAAPSGGYNGAFDIMPGQAPTAQSMGLNVQGLQRPASFAQPAQPAGGGFQIGGGPAAVAGTLGARPTVGPQPGNVAGQLGAAPQAGSVGNVAGQLGGYMGSTAGALGAAPGGIAGQLGAAPGSFSMGAAPGGINGQRSGYGATNAAQGEMLSRLSGFLDGPEGPSVAQAQLQQSSADNMAQLIGAARSGRGGAGAAAEAMRGAMSEQGAMMADTAGQMATLRAQEEDMRKNRQLSAIGLGGDMANAQRSGDLAFGGQELQALQGDQATALGARGQDLQGNIANQSAGLAARGQNLSALQGDQATALGARGQNLQGLLGDQSASIAARGQDLSALQGDQGTQLGLQQLQGQLALGARGQDLSALQGDQSTGLGYQQLQAQTALAGRGQDLSARQGDQSTALGARGQDLSALTSDADRQMAANQLNLQRELGMTGLGLDAQGQGLQYALGAEGQANALAQARAQNAANMAMNRANINAQPSFLENLGLTLAGGAAQGGGGALMMAAMSDNRAKTGAAPGADPYGASGGYAGRTGIDSSWAYSDEDAKRQIGGSLSDLEKHLDASPGYTYRYKDGIGEDPDVDHAGPMAQDLAKSPFGKSLVMRGKDGYLRVNTARLALVDHAALAHQKSELDSVKSELSKLRRYLDSEAA